MGVGRMSFEVEQEWDDRKRERGKKGARHDRVSDIRKSWQLLKNEHECFS